MTLGKYIRLSDQDGDCRPGEKAESNSVANQRALLNYFIANDPELAGCPALEFLDDGHTGTNFDRPGVQALFEAVRRGEVHCIVVKDLSRFGRDSLEVGEYLERVFPLLNVRFIAVNDGFDSRAKQYGTAGDLDTGVHNLINELYSRNVSVNVKTARRQYAERGECIAAYPFYGYVKSAENRRQLEIDPPAAETVRLIYTSWLEGNSTADIAGMLNERGISSPSMRKRELGAKRESWSRRRETVPWTQTAVRIILQNERYTGKLISLRTTRMEIGRLKQKLIPKKDWIVVPRAFEPIIDDEVFQKAQTLFRVSGTRPGPKRTEPPMFSGKLFCGICGLGLTYHRTARPSYRCRAPKGASLGQCKAVRIFEDDLKARVLVEARKYANEIKPEPDAGEEAPPQARIAALEQRIEKLWSAKKDAFVKWNDGLISQTEYERVCARKQDEIQRLRSELDLLKKGGADIRRETDGGVLTGLLEDSGAVELTREAVDALLQAVRVFDDKRVEIEWKMRGRA